MSAHTPGPWRWMNSNSLVGDHGRRPAVLTGVDIRQRGEDGRLRSLEVDSSDARLIAAAPDLLAVLKDAREELRLCREKDWSGPYDPTLKGRIDAAIAKAEGKS